MTRPRRINAGESTMDPVEKIAEEKIQAAMENGEFDNLPGRGKPVDLREYFNAPAHLRAAFSLLKNAGKEKGKRIKEKG